MNETVQTIMNRDDLTEQAAKEKFKSVKESIWDALASGADYDEIEDILMYDLGLEMDYIFDFL